MSTKLKSKFNFFPPIVNKPEIRNIDDVFNWMDNICDNESIYNDLELSNKLKEVYDYCAGGNPNRSFFLVQHRRSEELIKKRVETYCRHRRILVSDYDGPLPYRKFTIDSLFGNHNKITNRTNKLNKIKRKIFFNKFKIWRYIIGKK